MIVSGGRIVLIVAAAFAVGGSPALAQETANREAIYRQMLAQPGDVALAIRYARLSHEAGDIEAAIGALERILFFEPNEPNARLYLGILYGTLGSYDMARGYFETVLNHPATPEPIKARAAYLLSHTNKKLSPHQWSSYVRTGIRWQSNANGQPDGPYTQFAPDYYWSGNGEWRPATGDPQGDWNAYLNTGIAYAYDFGNQRDDRFEATVTSYSTRQFDFGEYNFNQIEATAGVRFGIPTDHATRLANIKPFIIASGALLDDEPYIGSIGFGITGLVPVGTWSFEPYAEAVWREYADDFTERADFIPDEFQGATGLGWGGGIRIASDPLAAYRFQARIGYERRDIKDDGLFIFTANGVNYEFDGDYQSYDRVSVELRFPFDVNLDGHQLLVTPLVGFRWTEHDSADPFVQDLTGVAPADRIVREDRQWRFGLALDYAINDWAGVGGQIMYTRTDSNLAAYETDNLTISFGPHFRW